MSLATSSNYYGHPSNEQNLSGVNHGGGAHSPGKYQENGHDTFSDFVTLVCQEAQNTQNAQVLTSFLPFHLFHLFHFSPCFIYFIAYQIIHKSLYLILSRFVCELFVCSLFQTSDSSIPENYFRVSYFLHFLQYSHLLFFSSFLLQILGF